MYARNSRTTHILAAAMMGLGLAGCRSFPADAPSRPARIESFSAVSDRPDSAIARKTPSRPGRISSRVDPPTDDPRQPQAVTGRVVDSSGAPVANARVRLAFDGASGSREVTGVSDREGAFRLRGLKPDGRYTLIAEWENSREVLIGRRRVEGTDREVEIEVRSPDDEGLGLDDSGEYRESSARQARSNQLYRDILPGQEAAEPALAGPVSGPARLASSRRLPAESPAPRVSSSAALPTFSAPADAAWTAGPASDRVSSARPPVMAKPDLEPAARLADPDIDTVAEENPLPPALEPGPPSSQDAPVPPVEDFTPVPDSPAPTPSPEPAVLPSDPEPMPAPSPAAPAPAPVSEPAPVAPAFEPYPTSPPSPEPSQIPEVVAPADPTPPANPTPPEPAGEIPLADPVITALPEVPSQDLTPPSKGAALTSPTAPVSPVDEDDPSAIESVPPVIERAEAEPRPGTPAPPAGDLILDDPPVVPPAEPIDPSSQANPAEPNLPPDDETPPVINSPAPQVTPTEAPSPDLSASGSEPPAEPPPAEEPPAESPPAVDPSPAPAITWNDLPPPGTIRSATEPSPRGEGPRPAVSFAGSRSPASEGVMRIGSKLLAPWGGPKVEPSCRFDPHSQRLNDFVLPDLQGRPFRRSDLQAQNILLVFWGSWSESCVQAISRLDELQEHHNPSQFQVVAIAYEQAEPEQRAQVVGSLARRLGIDFPILLGATDGSCPLQNALNVRYYPTYLLVDQYGRIQWRETGGGPDVLARLERAVTTAVHRSTQMASPEAPIARREAPADEQPATRAR